MVTPKFTYTWCRPTCLLDLAYYQLLMRLSWEVGRPCLDWLPMQRSLPLLVSTLPYCAAAAAVPWHWQQARLPSTEQEAVTVSQQLHQVPPTLPLLCSVHLQCHAARQRQAAVLMLCCRSNAAQVLGQLAFASASHLP